MDSIWYKQKDNVNRAIFQYVNLLEQKQQYRSDDNLRNMRLYGNMELNGLNTFNFARAEPVNSVQNRVTFNIVQSMCDTVLSKITKNKPLPYFLTDGADWSLKRKADRLNKFITGVFYSINMYQKGTKAFQLATILGTGAVKFYKQNNQIMAENVFTDELIVDDSEAYYGEPRQMHQRKWIHKDVLKHVFPKYVGAIDLEASLETGRTMHPYNKEMIMVIESWRLPSGKGANDGRHVISIQNETLLDEDYEKSYFPFVFFRWNERPLGFFGQGVAEQLTGIQLEINKILRTIQVSMHLVSVPKIFVEASSKIVTSHLNNKIGGIIKYAGTPPTEGKLGSIPQELFTHLNYLYQRAYEILGVSQLSAQSQKPQGLNSGKALRVYNDLETERFMDCAKRYEQCYLDAAKICIDLVKEIAAETNDFEVAAPGSGFLKKIKWSEVEMEDDQYMMQIFPTSALSQTPAAKLQEVQELMQAGLLDKEEGMRLLDFPDLKAMYNRKNSPVEDIHRTIELMLDTGEYQAPEPFQNLVYGIPTMQEAYLMYKSENAPDEILDLFRRWIIDAQDILDKATQPEAPIMTIGPDGQPMATPTAAPKSDLLPNVPQG